MDDEIKKWIEQAEEDLNTAKYNLDGGKLGAGVFFLQQSSEKALKAVYIKKFEDLLKTHDLVLLAKKLKAPDEIIEFCKELTPAYQYARYPDVPKMENINVPKLIKYSEEILKWAKKTI